MSKQLILGALIALLTLTATQACAWSQSVPNALVYTGFLSYSDSAAAINGTVGVELALHMGETPDIADPAVWATDAPLSVDVDNGILSVVLEGGAPVTVTDAVLAGAVWLQVTVDGNALSPRQEIVSVPFALRAAAADFAQSAGDAESVGGIDSAEVVTSSALGGMGLATETFVQSQGFAQTADLSAYLPKDGSEAMSGALDLGGQPIVNGGSAQFQGNVATPAPITGGHAANKDYVDAVVATAASSASVGGGGGQCYYAFNTQTCLTGYVRAPGENRTGGSTHIICCPANSPENLAAVGYFVLTESTYTGDLGGLAGANAACLAELQAGIWLGKGQASLSTANVRAFLCDSTTCQDPVSTTQYQFARVAEPELGGGSFVTDRYGRGPGNSETWSSGTEEYDQSVTYWTGARGTEAHQLWGVLQPNSTSSFFDACSDWSNGVSGNGRVGTSGTSGAGRWNSSDQGCGNALRLICMVDPITD